MTMSQSNANSQSAYVMTPARARCELVLWNTEAMHFPSSDIYLWLRDSGLPSEAAIRLRNLMDVTTRVANRILHIGKIVLIKVIEFVKAHPNLTIGIAVGASLGLMVSTIPFLGSFLMPIVTTLGVLVGAVAGHRRDKLDQQQPVNLGWDLMAVGQDVIEIAKLFFKLMIEIFNTVFEPQTPEKVEVKAEATQSSSHSQVYSTQIANFLRITLVVADRAIRIAKGILIKATKLAEVHPNTALGIAVGLGFGMLVSEIPLIGGYLAPVAMVWGMIVGGGIGQQLDD